jgi:hypothetical protein
MSDVFTRKEAVQRTRADDAGGSRNDDASKVAWQLP